jgi:hypothetical protein
MHCREEFDYSILPNGDGVVLSVWGELRVGW